MNLLAYPDREALFMGVADRLAGELGETLRAEAGASLAVPGGTTPGPVFDLLSAARLDWDRVTVLPTDERWVPESDPRSNARLIRQRLLAGRAAVARFVPLWGLAPSPEAAIPGLAAALEPCLPLSIALVGMGADGHVAGLFAGAEGLAAALAPDAPALVAIRSPALPEPRVSLSARVLAGALRIHILIAGEDKRAALDSARTSTPEEAPVRALLANATVHWAA